MCCVCNSPEHPDPHTAVRIWRVIHLGYLVCRQIPGRLNFVRWGWNVSTIIIFDPLPRCYIQKCASVYMHRVEGARWQWGSQVTSELWVFSVGLHITLLAEVHAWKVYGRHREVLMLDIDLTCHAHCVRAGTGLFRSIIGYVPIPVATSLLGSRFRIPPRTWIFVSCVCFGLCR